jgi:hypothetical protein
MSAAAQGIFSLGFGILYWEMASGLAGFEESAPIIGLIGTIAYLIAFFVPQALFRYTLKDNAATVLGQLSRRFGIAFVVTLVANIFIGTILRQDMVNSVPLAMELYSATFMGILVFHAMGGIMAEQGNYLQRTSQYNTNQLFTVVVALSVLFVLLTMYFLSFDLAVARAPRIYVRDMVFSTLAVTGFGWFVYRLAHH